MRRGAVGRVQDLDVARVRDAATGVHHAPGEVDPLVAAPELLRPAAGLLEDGAADRHRALPDRGDLARARRIADAQPRHPVAWRRPAVGGAHAQLEHAEAGVLEPRRHAGERVGRGEAGVVVEEEQQLAADRADAGVAPGRDAAVLLERDRAHVQPFGLPAVADDDDVELHAGLGGQRVERRRQLGRPAALGQHDAADHRRRSEVRIATRCPSAVIAVITTSAITSTREPIRSPATASTIAAASASIVASIATNAR